MERPTLNVSAERGVKFTNPNRTPTRSGKTSKKSRPHSTKFSRNNSNSHTKTYNHSPYRKLIDKYKNSKKKTGYKKHLYSKLKKTGISTSPHRAPRPPPKASGSSQK